MVIKYKKENLDSEIQVNNISKIIKKNKSEIFSTNNFFLIKKSKFVLIMPNNIKEDAKASE